MARVVLDTNVVVAALRSRRGASFAVLQQVADRTLRPLVTVGLFLEHEAVLKRPEQIAAHGYSDVEIDLLLAEFAALAEPVEVHFIWRPQLTDPSDELVLEAVVNGRGDALVTFNMDHFSSAARRFGFRLLRPADILRGVMS
jgi:putative PIN family toxin of toxin-antitoxin system